jgi:DNA-3-methyladenine glycosylase II
VPDSASVNVAASGALGRGRLAALDPGQAFAELQELPGIGPTYATLILLRATGVTDVLTFGEPRLASYAARFYGTGPEPLSPQQLDAIAGAWRPYRTWRPCSSGWRATGDGA